MLKNIISDEYYPFSTNQPITIMPGEVHIWYADDREIIDSDLLCRYLSCLSEEEKLQYEKFYFSKDRHQYLVTRAMVRNILSLYSHSTRPVDWVFLKNKFGKPFIKNELGDLLLKFNVSHTVGMIVVAVTRDLDVGVDVELPGGNGLDIALIKNVCSCQEWSMLSGSIDVTQKEILFYDLWTLKEAYLKARGTGITIPLSNVSFLFSGADYLEPMFTEEVDDDPINWEFHCLSLNSVHKIALVVKKMPCVYTISAMRIVPFRNFEKTEIFVKRKSSYCHSFPKNGVLPLD